MQLVWKTGGYPHTYTLSRAGRHGCDPCWQCGKRPGKGAAVWMNCYGDLYCHPCAVKLADPFGNSVAAELVAERIAALSVEVQ